MRIRKIEIESYRSVKHCEIRCGDVTVLIGRNNHGKSNVLAALEFFCGSGEKCKPDDFFRSKDQSSNELWVEVTFIELSDQEKTTFQKYVASDGTLRIRKSAELNDEGKVSIKYRGWISEPTVAWLQSVYTGTKKGDLEPELLGFLPDDTRYSKAAVEVAQARYIEAHLDDIEFSYSLEAGNFLGRPNVVLNCIQN